MIFVTVGTQLPFDRLVKTVDGWAAENDGEEVFAQVGESGIEPGNIESAQFLGPDDCREQIEKADVVVAHAGMGTIISALEMAKPVIVFPRRAELGEHRNDHQLATAEKLGARGMVKVAYTENDLLDKLNEINAELESVKIDTSANPELIDAVRGFIADA